MTKKQIAKMEHPYPLIILSRGDIVMALEDKLPEAEAVKIALSFNKQDMEILANRLENAMDWDAYWEIIAEHIKDKQKES